MVGSNSEKMKRALVKPKVQPYLKQSPRKIEYLTGKKQKVKNYKFQQNDVGFKSSPDSAGTNVANTLISEINHIIDSAKEEAINNFETAKRKAHESIKKAARQGWLINLGQMKHHDISKAVNEITISDMTDGVRKRTLVSSTTSGAEEESDRSEYEQADTNVSHIIDNKEAVIMDNLGQYGSYISDCIKATDLIAFFDLFTTAQRKELRSIYKRNPVEATKRAFEIIKTMTNQPEKYNCLLIALQNARYPKVVQILEGTLIPVGSRHRDIIRHCAKHIFQRLNTTEILPYLYSKEIISHDDMQQIQRTEKTESTGIAALELLDILPSRDTRWYRYFIESLVKSGHEDLATIIENTNQITETPRKNTIGSYFDGVKQTKDHKGETVHPEKPKSRFSLSKYKPKSIFLSDVENTSENDDDGISLTHEVQLQVMNGAWNPQNRPAISDRIPSPISVSSDDYSCVQASRLDHGLDLSDSSFPLDE